jgi:hypothetical protein
LIVEEYGYRDWLAKLDPWEYQDLIRRWKTIRGLTCLVPVKLIVPQAKELDDLRPVEVKYDKRCHIHEHDDSYLQDVDYKIPEDTHFWMDGRMYTEDEYWPKWDYPNV